jgi:hypothetical protein
MPASRRRSALTFLLVVAAAVAVVLAGSVTVAPAADTADPAAGPKAAMRAFYEAMEAGDVAGVRGGFHTATDAERDLADAYAAQLTAAKAVGDAARAKYGATGDALARGLPAKDEIARLDAAEVAVDNDQATLKLPGQPKPLRLTRAQGKWRIVLSDYAGGPPEGLAGQTAVLRDMAAALQSTATDILADKYPAAQDAQRALQQKLQTVLFKTLQKHPPATAASTTSPTTRPKP